MPVKPLEAYGVTEDSLDCLADDAMKGGDHPNNPRMTTKEDFICLYKQAMKLKK